MLSAVAFLWLRKAYYDAADELTSAGANSYSFDLNGNRNYTTGPGNQLTGDGVYTYVYDNEGNLTSKRNTSTGETWTYGYDNLNELTSAVNRSSTGTLGPGIGQTAGAYRLSDLSVAGFLSRLA
jgi:YD repeat-containing protein